MRIETIFENGCTWRIFPSAGSVRTNLRNEYSYGEERSFCTHIIRDNRPWRLQKHVVCRAGRGCMRADKTVHVRVCCVVHARVWKRVGLRRVHDDGIIWWTGPAGLADDRRQHMRRASSGRRRRRQQTSRRRATIARPVSWVRLGEKTCWRGVRHHRSKSKLRSPLTNHRDGAGLDFLTTPTNNWKINIRSTVFFFLRPHQPSRADRVFIYSSSFSPHPSIHPSIRHGSGATWHPFRKRVAIIIDIICE